MPPPLALATTLLAALLAANAGAPDSVVTTVVDASKRSKSLVSPTLPAGCLYEDGWHREGATVPTGEACLHCGCRHGALSCRRRACAPMPDSPPHRCHMLHRKGACCPELHCADGITLMEQGALARFESDEDIITPISITHACVEGGTVYAAGSAMRSALACEQCFCLGGSRRCVRPHCLPPPAGCKPRPSAGACCPQRYYCEHKTNKPPEEKHPHDCKVNDKWIPEGERVTPAANEGNCTQCFCLRGAVKCQPLSCAPPLMGCKPLLRAGECCAHQYHCEHSQHRSKFVTQSSNVLSSARNDDRSFHTSKSTNLETTTKITLENVYTARITPKITVTKNHLISTTKVKRKTSDLPLEISSFSPQNTTVLSTSTTVTQSPTTKEQLVTTTVAKLITTTETSLTTSTLPTPHSTTDFTTEIASTEQPEGSVRIMINGTINCTAELSSTSLPLNMSFNDTEKINSQSQPRVPLIDVSNLEDHTFSANDIITDRTISEGFDENESFIINVTSSLNTNINNNYTSTKVPLRTVAVSVPPASAETNSSKKTKGDYDYDYTEPTLPPSLPNLKIIPFVAADAVVEDDNPKDAYPILEREDKFPVYYPNTEAKDSPYVTRREDVYRSTQYPVFITDKSDHDQYPSLTSDIDLTNSGYSDIHTDLNSSVNEYTVSASLDSKVTYVKSATLPPLTTTTLRIEKPAVNLFSPPVETEGGFIPKGPTGLIDEYFAVFPSTPSGLQLPPLTTSMQLDIMKGECVSGDGRHVPEGESITLGCSECTCVWSELHCSPRPCLTPPGCRRRPASSNGADLCCGEIICARDHKNTAVPDASTAKTNFIEAVEITPTTESITKIEKVIAIDDQQFSNNNTVITDNPSNKQENLSHSEITSISFSKNETLKHDNIPKTSTSESTTTRTMATTTSAAPIHKTTTQNNNHSLEYDEEEEDDSFSFGSVLKLLLSDNYETTTSPPKKTFTTTKKPPTIRTTTTRRPRPTLPPVSQIKPSIAPFVPLPIHSYIPSKANHNSINRIDHLVLGEATAIKKTTPRSVTTTVRPIITNKPTSRLTTPGVVSKPTELTIEEGYSTQDSPRPPGGFPGLGPGILKLAGCNIYGIMYRVGNIITELSTPCQECWCTEFGVQCKQLKC